MFSSYPTTDRHEYPLRVPDQRSPLLWVLVPYSIAIIVCFNDSTGRLSAWSWLVGASLSGIIWIRLYCSSFGDFWYGICVRRIFLIVFVFCVGGGYLALRIETADLGVTIPPIQQKLWLSEISCNAIKKGKGGDYRTGFATVVPTNQMKKQKVFFQSRQYLESLPLAGRIEAEVLLTPISEIESHSFRDYLKKNKVYYTGQIIAIKQFEPSEFPWIKLNEIGLPILANALERDLFDKKNSKNLQNLRCALTLGQKEKLSPSQKDAFLRTGTAHLFAVSGLHIGLFALVINGLLALTYRSEYFCWLITFITVSSYVFIIGCPTSALRALTMLGCYYLVKTLQRQNTFLPIMCLTALILLSFDPKQLYSYGFILSFSAVIALYFLGLPLSEHLKKFFQTNSSLSKRVMDGVVTSLAVSLATFGACMAYIADIYGVVGFSGIGLNLILVPIATVVIGCAIFTWIGSLIGIPWIPEMFNTLSNGLLWIADQSVHFFAQQKWLQASYQFNSSWGASITSLSFLFSILILYKLIKKKLWAGGIPFLLLGLGLKVFGTVG